MKNISKKSVSLVLIFTILMAIFMPTTVNANDVGRIGTSKVGTIVMAYTGGNSQVYVNKITKQDGTVVRYVYSSNFIVTPSTIAKLKSVLASEYSSLIPDNYTRDDNVGIKVCSDSSLVNSMNENWTSSEWVGRNVVAVGSVKNATNEVGDGINQTAISNAQSRTVLFNEVKTASEAANRAKWEAIEQERKASWDAAEAEKKEADPNYIPQEYVHWEYVPLDFGTMNETDIQNVKALENFQVAVPGETHIQTSYSFEAGKLVEVSNITIINHVASIYTEHTSVDDTATAEEKPTYEYIDNTANQTYTINKDDNLTFRINADYPLFENGGKVYVDGTETTEYTSKSGSTIITLNKDFVNSLSVGEHTLKVAFNNGGEATTKFTIAKTEETTQTETATAEETTQTETATAEETKAEESTSNNPKTGDNIAVWISLMVVSMLGVAGTIKYTKKRK